MRCSGAVLLACALWLFGSWARADSSAGVIDGLLTRVENSSCQFLRNGSAYSGKDAAAHLRKKRDIAQRGLGAALTPEVFIQRVASRSELSGLPYRIDCAGTSRLLSEWLQEQLHQLQPLSVDPVPAVPAVPAMPTGQ